MSARKWALVIVILGMILAGCGGDNDNDTDSDDRTDNLAEYGVPAGTDLSEPCSLDGSWETDTPDKIAKTASAALTYFASRFDGRMNIEDWLIEIEWMDWEYTGVCITIWYVTACDYASYYSGEVSKGYIDPSSAWVNESGNTEYVAYTNDGLVFEVIEDVEEDVIYLRIDPDGDGENHFQTLYLETS